MMNRPQFWLAQAAIMIVGFAVFLGAMALVTRLHATPAVAGFAEILLGGVVLFIFGGWSSYHEYRRTMGDRTAPPPPPLPSNSIGVSRPFARVVGGLMIATCLIAFGLMIRGRDFSDLPTAFSALVVGGTFFYFGVTGRDPLRPRSRL